MTRARKAPMVRGAQLIEKFIPKVCHRLKLTFGWTSSESPGRLELSIDSVRVVPISNFSFDSAISSRGKWSFVNRSSDSSYPRPLVEISDWALTENALELRFLSRIFILITRNRCHGNDWFIGTEAPVLLDKFNHPRRSLPRFLSRRRA